MKCRNKLLIRKKERNKETNKKTKKRMKFQKKRCKKWGKGRRGRGRRGGGIRYEKLSHKNAIKHQKGVKRGPPPPRFSDSPKDDLRKCRK
jgi:hypothetical protein